MKDRYFFYLGATVFMFFGISHTNGYSQNYYITKENDTVFCDIIKEYPTYIKIKKEGSRRKTLRSSEISSYKGDLGVILKARKATNDLDSSSFFLPMAREDVSYSYNENNVWVNVTSNGKITIYELVFPMLSAGMPSSIKKVYIDSDSLGISRLYSAGVLTSKEEKNEILELLKKYLADNKELLKDLNSENKISVTWKGIEKILEQFFNKELTQTKW